MSHTFEVKVGLDKFPVVIGNGIFKQIKFFIDTYDKKNIFIICDSFFKDSKNCSIKEISFVYEYNHLFVDGGIESKTLPNYQKILKVLTNNSIARDGLIVSIGGGVVGDLSAFIASTYQRGIDLVHVPTTTTAMIDSSIGGKTGLNLFDQVNLIGSYYNPKAIFMDLRFLLSLKERDFNSGICEALKMSITSDKEMFHRYFSIQRLVHLRDIDTLKDIVFGQFLLNLSMFQETLRKNQ